MIILSKRLQAILDTIPRDTDLLVDVGCDHGKLVCAAVKNDYIRRGIGIDCSDRSLQKAKNLSLEKGLASSVSFIHGDGLDYVTNSVDVVVIAGLGANEIVKIIRAAKCIVKKFILCPHQDAHVLRKYLLKNKYGIEQDTIIYDNGKYYPIIVTSFKCTTIYSEVEMYLGKNKPESTFFTKRNNERLHYIQNLLTHTDRLSGELTEEYKELLLWQKSKK